MAQVALDGGPAHGQLICDLAAGQPLGQQHQGLRLPVAQSGTLGGRSQIPAPVLSLDKKPATPALSAWCTSLRR